MRRTDHIHACLLAAVTLALATGTSLAFFPTNLRTTIVPLEDTATRGSPPMRSRRSMPSSSACSRRADRCGRRTRRSSTATSTSTTTSSTRRSTSTARTSSPGRAVFWDSRRVVIASIQQNDAQGAREELGQALHSIQDFYAHSNWTNNNGGVNPDLGVDGSPAPEHARASNDPAEVNGVLTTAAHQRLLPRRGPRRRRLAARTATRTGTAAPSTACRSWTSASASTATATIPTSRRSRSSTRWRRTSRSEATKKYIREIADQLTAEAGRAAARKGTDARHRHRHDEQHGADHRGGPEPPRPSW